MEFGSALLQSDDGDKPQRRITLTSIAPSKGMVATSSVNLPVIELEFPSDLKKCSNAEIQQLCSEHQLSLVARNKWELIGRVLVLFPKEILTEENLDKFTHEQLMKMCSGAWVSNKGTKEDLIQRLIRYATQGRNHLVKVREKKKYKARKIGDSDRLSHPNISPTPSKKPSKKRPLDNKSNNPPPKKRKLMEPSSFLDIAPSIPLTIENHYYELNPQMITDQAYGWKKSGKQTVKVSGQDYTVQWNLNMTILPPEDEE